MMDETTDAMRNEAMRIVEKLEAEGSLEIPSIQTVLQIVKATRPPAIHLISEENHIFVRVELGGIWVQVIAEYTGELPVVISHIVEPAGIERALQNITDTQ